MVGKKSGKALLREEGLERTDNGMKQSSWPDVPMINQKNYYTYVTLWSLLPFQAQSFPPQTTRLDITCRGVSPSFRAQIVSSRADLRIASI